MYEPFELPIDYKGEEQLFPAQLEQSGYTHRFRVHVNGQDIFFEPDEERNYRAVIDPEHLQKAPPIELLQAIATTLESLVK